jgi:hypothetical protein
MTEVREEVEVKALVDNSNRRQHNERGTEQEHEAPTE